MNGGKLEGVHMTFKVCLVRKKWYGHAAANTLLGTYPTYVQCSLAPAESFALPSLADVSSTGLLLARILYQVPSTIQLVEGLLPGTSNRDLDRDSAQQQLVELFLGRQAHLSTTAKSIVLEGVPARPCLCAGDMSVVRVNDGDDLSILPAKVHQRHRVREGKYYATKFGAVNPAHLAPPRGLLSSMVDTGTNAAIEYRHYRLHVSGLFYQLRTRPVLLLRAIASR
ncbi:hypothetical protein L210DRAFT_3661032 [Boletus edulis BED1]|uniref:Uncharacterized protein n=1 Tax=Boletus edulis BED1 TaxID=1328754 RepID=A0AAD4GLE7_BOLED|nr:hypothetical protein L210DRAFT_3661032 [Boletus edulis BED1]